MNEASTRTRRQTGFTLPEILAVIVLIGILMTTIATGFGSAENELALASSKDTLLNEIPAALISYRAKKGSLTGIAKTDITGAGVSSEGPFGDSWSVGTVTARTVIISWVVTGAASADTFGADLKSSLELVDGSAISTHSYDATSDTLSVTYRVP